MKVKVFMGTQAPAVEAEINAWLDGAGSLAIIKTDTAITAVAARPNDDAMACVVVTVWYEPSAE